MTQTGSGQPVPPQAQIVKLVFGHMAAQTLEVAVQLGVADLLGDDEHSSLELAESSDTHPGAMNRLLRALAALGLLTETRPGRFTLSEAGSLLRTDRPDSMQGFVRMFRDPAVLQAWEGLETSVRTGRVAFDEMFGTDFFAHLAGNEELSALFNAAMRQTTYLTAKLLPTSYDFGRFSTVVDVGGGDGTLLAAVLAEHPGVNGILFDTPEGAAQADEVLEDAGVAGRCTVTAGDFFTSVPSGGDLYMTKSVIHDWDDDRATTILSHCRTALGDEGKLLIIEPVIPDTVDGSRPAFTYLGDLNMLVNLGGRERTRGDFEQLCHDAGFNLDGVTPLPPPSSFALIEATPA